MTIEKSHVKHYEVNKMAIFTTEEVKQATGGIVEPSLNGVTYLDIVTDTRQITKDCLFVALKGEKFDGHSFVKEAVKKGASAVVVDHKIQGVPCIVVEDTLKAYQDLAHFHRMRFSIPVVAITGSSGKTTTKEMVGAILSSQMNIVITEKNFNNEIGLPKTLLRLDESHEACVVEMGMRGFGQIEELAKIAQPTIGVVTNVGTSHIELLGSQEGIAKAKSELVRELPETGYAILNSDDPWVAAMEKMTDAHCVTYGQNPSSTVAAIEVSYRRNGMQCKAKLFDQLYAFFLPMVGIHNIYDALAAIAVGKLLGINEGKMQKALGDFTSLPMRQEIVNCGPLVLFNDAYNANPSSMAEAIRAVGHLEGKRKIAMVGDMLELGDYTEKAHREIGELLAAEQFDMVFAYGEASQYIAEAAKEGGVPVVVSSLSHDEIAEKYKEKAEKGDTVLIKGSRGMTMEKIAELIEKWYNS